MGCIDGTGCSREGAAGLLEMLHSKPAWIQGGLLTQAHMTPCSACNAPVSSQARSGDEEQGAKVALMGKAGDFGSVLLVSGTGKHCIQGDHGGDGPA